MTKKLSLVATNPYLQNPKKREKMIKNSVITSTKIEGVDFAKRRSQKPPING
ncbi:MAG TPA: hypothetical protein PLD88_00475 [Candidatus Berkiella sp.]|nr:hypothetical protein [Candidatus Berkiella sp.]